jgi:hypothetical protein
MAVDLERIRQYAEKASTEELLDRVTVFRAGMEPEAIVVIETELHRRGVDQEKVAEFEQLRRRDGLIGGDVPRTCSYCDRPAIVRAWGFARGRSLLPIIPWRFSYCEEHHKTRWAFLRS